MKALLVLGCLAFFVCDVLADSTPLSQQTNTQTTVIVLIGAPGEKEYEQVFERSSSLWDKACQQAGAREIKIGLEPSSATNDLEQFKAALSQEPKNGDAELWLVLLGHGTFDGKEAKFNLRGPDLAGSELAALLHDFERPLAIVDTSSASSPFLNKLSHDHRVIITATRSGYEQNYTRFGQFLSAAIGDPKADLDKDGQVSLLECFLKASHDLLEFYKTEGRLATEHPLIDDNGDAMGTPPEWFRGIRAVKKAASGAAPDGLRAHQLHLLPSEAERKLSPEVRARRNQLELSLEELRATKETLPEDDYYDRLEKVLLQLAEVYQASDKK